MTVEKLTEGVCVSKLLKQTQVSASAPCRIDSGGTWDIKAMGLAFGDCKPATVNIALSLRTRVDFSPCTDGKIKIISDGFLNGVEYDYTNISLEGPFSIFFAAVRHFGFHGLTVHIKSDSPVKSALGGSSTALVALLKALSKLAEITCRKGISKKELLHLGYQIEDGISGGNCGMQDQAAAVYGGVNCWEWTYWKRTSYITGNRLLDSKGAGELSKRILVAYSGKSHVSAATNRLWLAAFLRGETRQGWIEANSIVREFSEAIKKKRWSKAAFLLKEEMNVRKKITPDALIPETERLIKEAENYNCGARFTGAGAGGSLWAMGSPDDIIRLGKEWKKILAKINGASLLECRIDSKGVF